MHRLRTMLRTPSPTSSIPMRGALVELSLARRGFSFVENLVERVEVGPENARVRVVLAEHLLGLA